MSHNGHPNPDALGDIPIDPAMTQTQVQIQPVQQQAIFSPFDPHAAPSMSSYPYSPHPPATSAEQYRSSPTVGQGSMHLPPIRSIEPRQGQPLQPQTPIQTPYPQVVPPQMPGYHPHMGPMSPYYPQAPMHPGYVPVQLAPGEQPAMHPASTIPPPPPGRWPQGLPLPPDHRTGDIARGRNKKEVKRRTKTGCLTCRKRRIKPQHGPSSIQNAPHLTQSGSDSPTSAHSYTTPSLGQVPSVGPSRSSTTDSPRSAHSQADPQSHFSAEPPFGQAFYSASSESRPEGPSSLTSHPTPTMRSPIPTIKQLGMEDLHSIGGYPPPIESSYSEAVSAQDHDRITNHFRHNYGPAIDRLFEASFWTSEGLRYLTAKTDTMVLYKQHLDHLAGRESSTRPSLLSEESILLWQLFRLCNDVEQPPPMSAPLGFVNHSPKDRLQVFQALLTGETLPLNPLMPKSLAGADSLRMREFEFWFCIGQIVSIEERDADTAKQLDGLLERCRAVLDKQEQRDVLYSISMIRTLGRRWGGMLQSGPGAAEAQKHFEIARNFIETETTRGTNSVIQRLCGMARKAWTT
ncbi:MAG: hypothetical protein Q9227_006406 [Pyrenula ochraceoflavens]